jgi:hypothetical protein
LARPEAQASVVHRLSKKARFELLSWFGVLGATITVTTNLRGILAFATWIRTLSNSWLLALKTVWSYVLFFIPSIPEPDAVLLSYIAFSIINVAVCLRTDVGVSPGRSGVLKVLGLIIPYAGISFLFLIGIGTAGNTLSAGAGLAMFVFGFFVAFVLLYRLGVMMLGTKRPILLRILAVMFAALVLGSLVALVVNFKFEEISPWIAVPAMLILVMTVPTGAAYLFYLICRAVVSIRLDTAALSLRLWRILVGIGLIAALNEATVWAEQQPWLMQLIK